MRKCFPKLLLMSYLKRTNHLERKTLMKANKNKIG